MKKGIEMSKRILERSEYTPWIVVNQNELFVIVRDPICPSPCERVYHELESGKPEKHHDAHHAWDVAHRLNSDLYWETEKWKRNNKNWIQTFTSQKFHPTDPIASQICIEDIAHALSHTNCRFGGQCEFYYSVAQHCVLGSYHCEDPLWFLLHDATEAYLVDIPRPIKECFPAYKKMEDNLMRAVAVRFNLPYPFPECVHETDNRMLETERMFLFDAPMWRVPGVYPIPGVEIIPWTHKQAKNCFLQRFAELREQQEKPALSA